MAARARLLPRTCHVAGSRDPRPRRCALSHEPGRNRLMLSQGTEPQPAFSLAAHVQGYRPHGTTIERDTTI